MSSQTSDRSPTVECVYCRVMLVPQNQGKLCASVPALHRLHASFLIALLQIEGGKVDIIPVWEKQYPPNISSIVSSFQFKSVFANPSHEPTYQGCPPHSNIGPRAFRGRFLQPSISHVCTISLSVSKSCISGRNRAFMASSANELARSFE